MAREPAHLSWLEIVKMLWGLAAAVAALLSFIIEAPIYAIRRERRIREAREEEEATTRRLSLQPDIESLRRSLELRVAAADFPSKKELISKITDDIMEYEVPTHNGLYPAQSIWVAYHELAWRLLQAEGFSDLPKPTYTDEIGKGRYIDELIAHRRKLENPTETMALLVEAVSQSFLSFTKRLPPSAFTLDTEGHERRHLGYVSLLDMLTDLPGVVLDTVVPFFLPKMKDRGLFSGLREQADANDARAGGELPEMAKFRGTATQMVDAYLTGTPLRALFDVQIPFDIRPEDRLEHWHLLAPTGWGKTQTLQHVIYHDLIAPDAPALVIIEPKGDMVATIQKLKLFADDPDRLVVIDPELSPALNMFAIPNERRKRYSQTVQEQIEASIIEQYGYIFSALDAEMSRKQSTALSYVVKLVLAKRGNILDFIKILDDPSKELSKSPFEESIRTLDDIAQGFFETQFFNPQSFGMTRRSLASKLYGLLAVPAFRRMFAASENHLDMFQRIQTPGSVTLVNTAKGLLKKEASSLFGRYMIAQTTSAAFERVAIPERDRKPAYLIIDEAGSYFDDSLEELLAEVRSMGVGVLFAHQLMSQLKTRSLKSSVQGNTSIKFAAPSDEDASECASAMHTSADFLRSMRQTKGKSTQFGVYIRGETPTALRLKVPFLTMENAPQMTPEEHQQLKTRIRSRFSSHAAASTASITQADPNIAPPRDPADDTVHSTPAKQW